MYAISVSFYERGYWSRSYTYLWHEPVNPGSVALVPKDAFYSVAKVIGCTDRFTKDPKINYKKLSAVVENLL